MKILIFVFSMLFFTGCLSTKMQEVHVVDVQSYGVDEEFNVSKEWWKSFGVEELDGLVQNALENNRDILVAYERIIQAQISVDVARGKYLPDASTSISSSQSNSKVRGSDSVTSDSLNARGNASYEIDLWGRISAQNNIADIDLIMSEYDRQSIELSIVSSVVSYYFNFLSNQKNIQITKNNLVISESLLNIVKKKYEAGVVSVIDLNRQTSSHLQVQTSLLALETQQKAVINSIAILLGISADELGLKGGELDSVKWVEIGAGVPSELLIRRPDIASKFATLQRSYESLHVSKANRYPSFSLTGALGAVSTSLLSFSNPTTLSSSFGLGISYSLFDGGALKGAQQIAMSEIKIAELNFKQSFVDALVEVQNALNNRTLNKEQLKLSKEILELNLVTLKQSEIMYQEGLVDFTTVLDAQNSYFSAENSQVNYLTQYLESLVQLSKVLGGGWTKE